MNVETGELKEFDSMSEMKRALERALDTSQGNLVQVDTKDMTEKQKKERKVSIHDNKSKLGKILQEKRKLLGYSQMNRNQRRNLKKRLNK